MITKQSLFRISILSLLLLIMSASCFAASYTGYGPTRRAALIDAQRMALEANGVLIESSSSMKNYEIIDDRVYTRSGGYIKAYSIVRDIRYSDREYLVEIANVSIAQKEKELRDIEPLQSRRNIDVNMGNPRIGILMYTTGNSETLYGREIFVEAFRNAGFTLYDTQQMNSAIKRSMGVANNISDPALLENLKQLGVDYLCRIKIAYAEQRMGYSGNTHIGSSEVIGDIIDTNTGRIVASAQGDQGGGIFSAWNNMGFSSGEAQRKAIKNAMKKVAKELVLEMKGAAASVENAIEVDITASYGNFSSAAEAQDWLESLPGVRRTFVRSAYYGSIIIDVYYDGIASDLVRSINRAGREAMFSNNKVVM